MVLEGASSKDIKKIERYFGVELPTDYAECAVANNGGRPWEDKFETSKGTTEQFNLLFDLRDNSQVWNPIEVYEDIRDRLEGKIIPFADDPGGNMLCFDYRKTKSNPKIVFWDHEIANTNPKKALTPACDTFTDLLNMLHE